MTRAQGSPSRPRPIVSVKTVDAGDRIVVLHIAGDIDLGTASHVNRHVRRVLAITPPAFIINLSEVTFLDSAGVALLVEAHKEAQLADMDLSVVADHRVVLRPIEITGLAGLFRIHRDVSQAVAAARKTGDAVP